MKSAGPAPAPDPRIGDAAERQAALGEEWLSFARDAFAVSTERQADLDALTRQVAEQQIGLANEQADISRADRARYEEKFRPIEDEFVEEAANYASPERQEAAAAAAKADVQSVAAGARETARREAASLGLDPTSGRFAGIERGAELGGALATAGAANTARQQVRDKGLALKADVVNLGKGLPTSAAQAAQLGIGAGNSAVGLTQGANSQYMASTGIMGQGFSGAGAGYGNQASTMLGLHEANMDAWDSKNKLAAANASGFGSAIGTGLGLILSDEEVKTDKAPIAEGDALEAVKSMPVESWRYEDGAGDGGAHVGPYAQDFQAATGKGDGKSIPAQDAIGLALKAVQDVDAKVERIAEAVGLGLTPANDRGAPRKRVAANANGPGLGLGKGAM